MKSQQAAGKGEKEEEMICAQFDDNSSVRAPSTASAQILNQDDKG